MGNRTTVKRKAIKYRPYTWDGISYTYLLPKYIVRTMTSTRQGFDNPMYKTNILNGISATNRLIASKEKISLVYGYICGQARFGTPAFQRQVFKNTNVNTAITDTVNLPYPTDVNYATIKTNAKNTAAIRIRKKIYEQTSTWSGPQFLGELRDTIHQLKHPAEAAMSYAHKYLKDVKKKHRHGKRYKAGGKVEKAFAGSWLEFQFGLAPLVGDIAEILKSTQALIESKRIMRLSAVGLDETAFSSRASAPQGNYLANFAVNRIALAKHKYTVGLKMKASPEKTLNYMLGNQTRMESLNTSFDLIIQSGGFDIDQTISTIWELIPLSVFVDYFSNIGDVLQTAMVSLNDVAWTNSTSILDVTDRLDDFSFNTDGSWLYRPDLSRSPRGEINKKFVDRDNSAVVIPQLRFSLPGSPKRLANLGAFLLLLTT